MSRSTLRFGVVEGDQSASTWRLWTELNREGSPEVYLLCRELGDKIHASMHASGRWRIGYSKKYFAHEVSEVMQEGADRVIQKWNRPQEVQSGVVLAFHLITPPGSLRYRNLREIDGLIRIPSAPPGKCTEVLISFLSQGKDCPRTFGTVIGEIPLVNGEYVKLSYRVRKMLLPALPPTCSPQYLKDRSVADLASGSFSALIFGDTALGSRVIWDCLVRISPRLRAKAIYWKLYNKLSSLFYNKLSIGRGTVARRDTFLG